MIFLSLFLFYCRISCSAASECRIYTSNTSACEMADSPDNIPCTTSPIAVCRQNFKIYQINVEPFSYILNSWFYNVTIPSCCGKCASRSVVKIYPNVERFLRDLTANSTARDGVVYPVLGKQTPSVLYGYRYFPFLNAPKGVYITQKDMSKTIDALLTACLNLWPLLLVCLLMALIAGFIGWLLDTWTNEDEFPRPFMPGVFEGFWWSFVSMTTVGYGDKSPRAWASRLFAVCWILIGITICSMFTASLTTAISSVGDPPTMKGSKVGILEHRLYDEQYVLEKGGKINRGAFRVLLDNVKAKTIDGIFMDEYTAFSYFNFTQIDTDDFVFTDQDPSASDLAYGILIADSSTANFLSSYLKDNKKVMETCLRRIFLQLTGEEEKIGNVFSVDGGLFYPSFISCLVSLILIGLFGVLYEYNRRSKKKVSASDQPVGNDMLEEKVSEMYALLKEWSAKHQPSGNSNVLNVKEKAEDSV